MSTFITDFQSFAQKELETKKPEFKHGLSISVKPRDDSVLTIDTSVKDNPISITGSQPYDIRSVPKTFSELFDTSLLTSDDFISTEIAAKAEHISCLEISQNTDITISGNAHILAIVLKEHSSSIINIHSTNNAKIRIHIVGEVNANATINHIQEDTSIIVKKIILKNDAQVSVNDIVTTDTYARLYEHANLVGKNSSIKQKVISLTYDFGIADIYTASEHTSEYSFSDIITRSVISQSSKTLSRGLVKINQDAANSEGYEQQDALLLSDECEADAIPNLEIHNHNVKCSHGSTVGKVDKEKLFYLMSRGLSENDALKEIIKAYFQPIIDQFENEELETKLHELLEAKL